MNAEFNWWLLIVGLGAGAAITWLVLSDLARRDDELADREREDEAAWLADELARSGIDASVETISRVLDAHRAYLRRDAGGQDEDAGAFADDAFEDGAFEAAFEADESPAPSGRAEARAETGSETRVDQRPEVADPT